MKTLVDSRYFELVKRFPLLHIRDDEQLEAAQSIVDQLADKYASGKISRGEREYLNALSDLVIKYESTLDFGPVSKMTPVELVRYLMAENSLKQNDLAELFGGQSHVSDFLNSKRELSKNQIANLSKRFKLAPSAFF